MTELSPNTRRVLELARNQDDPTPAVQQRVERALATKIALGGGAAALGVAGKSALAAKVLAPLGIVTAVAGAGWYSLGETSRERPVPAQATTVSEARTAAIAPAAQTTAVAPPNDEPPRVEATPEFRPRSPKRAPAVLSRPEADEETPVARRPERPEAVPPRELATNPESDTAAMIVTPEGDSSLRPVASTPAPVSTGPLAGRSVKDPLLAETEALRAAQRALRSGDTKEALELLDAQDRTYRSGALEEERAAARVLVLCQSGETKRARAAAERFVHRWPRSALRARVISACRGPFAPP